MSTPTEARLGRLPHFEVTTVDGRRVRYGDLWQRRNVILILARPDDRDAADRYASALQAGRTDLESADVAVVATTDTVAGLTTPSVVVADRWGEIVHMEAPPPGQLSSFPDPDELWSWVHFVRIQCPECPP